MSSKSHRPEPRTVPLTIEGMDVGEVRILDHTITGFLRLPRMARLLRSEGLRCTSVELHVERVTEGDADGGRSQPPDRS